MKTGLDQSTPEGLIPYVKTAVSWIAAALGIGTVAGLVNVVVGLLSGAWIAAQLWAHFRYDVPLKRERLRAAQRAADASPWDDRDD